MRVSLEFYVSLAFMVEATGGWTRDPTFLYSAGFFLYLGEFVCFANQNEIRG